MNDLPETLERLSTRIDALEKRLEALEHPSALFAQPHATPHATPAAALAVDGSIGQTGAAFPILGKAMLGIAGAYVLRAVSESSLISGHVIAAVAIAYAVAWLVVATRLPVAAYFAGTIYAATSALILTPMLWELTLRFRVLSPAWAAGVLGGFAILATALTWNRNRLPALWVAQITAAAVALALAIATHSMVPFIDSLLLMVLVCEFAALRHRAQPVRPLVVALADVAIGALIFVYSGSPSARVDYPVLGGVALLVPASLLFLTGVASIAVRTTSQKQTITVYEALQAMIAFLLAVSSVLSFSPRAGVIVMSAVCVILSAASYAASFIWFREPISQRSFRIFTSWGAGLLLAGAFWGLPRDSMSACLGLAALVAIVFGVRLACMTLKLHSVIYLAAAAIVSRLPQYVFRTLAGSMPSKPAWSVFLVSMCALLCYAVGKERLGETWGQQALHLVPALLIACSVTAFLAQGLLGLAALAIVINVFQVAFIRTLTICSVALALAFVGSRWQRPGMTRIAYVALAFMAAKLLFEDLRIGRMEFIAASIFLFAITLIGVPRLVRMGHKP